MPNVIYEYDIPKASAHPPRATIAAVNISCIATGYYELLTRYLYPLLFSTRQVWRLPVTCVGT